MLPENGILINFSQTSQSHLDSDLQSLSSEVDEFFYIQNLFYKKLVQAYCPETDYLLQLNPFTKKAKTQKYPLVLFYFLILAFTLFPLYYHCLLEDRAVDY